MIKYYSNTRTFIPLDTTLCIPTVVLFLIIYQVTNGDTIIVSLKRLFYCIFLNEIHYNLLSGFPELTVPNSVIKQKSKISYIRGQSNEPRMYFYPDNDASYGELYRGVNLTIISICFSSYKK